MSDDLTFRDFSLTPEQAKRKFFTVDGEDYVLPVVLAPVLLGELMEAAKGIGGFNLTDKASVDAALERVASMMELLLTEPAAARFRERLFSRTEPLDLVNQVLPIVRWTVEVYSVRPTEASSDSTNGSGDAGGISTDTAPIEESTLGASPLFVS